MPSELRQGSAQMRGWRESSRTIPLEDVGAVVLSSFKATLTSNLLIELARKRIGFVLCESYRPAVLLLPADRATDTALLRHLADMPARLRNRLWQKTLDAKCGNQTALAQVWNPHHPAIAELKRMAVTEKTAREAECARLFWSVFADTWANSDFRRGRHEEGLITSSTMRTLFCCLAYCNISLRWGWIPASAFFINPGNMRRLWLMI